MNYIWYYIQMADLALFTSLYQPILKQKMTSLPHSLLCCCQNTGFKVSVVKSRKESRKKNCKSAGLAIYSKAWFPNWMLCGGGPSGFTLFNLFEVPCSGEGQEGISQSAAEGNPSSVVHVAFTGSDRHTMKFHVSKTRIWDALSGHFIRSTCTTS